ncbi:Arabinose 5-phosphate isomerase KpsF [Madurella mycetomatis]|uniref:Arabinose 5-phosphate isomerase KpsF n=1 Tax=Madurella mycetomatis TaxID=100816 RepID=A0A175W0A5_9PEZI|nr:Arabinose 5-phosphate isomerase KpsF [Madurella mycetomatis]KXX77815.1 Arabinose 5-phosphate isomerase KpsF [Madurella mycetomatis]
MVEQRAHQGPVQNSEVYVLRQVTPFSTIPPLSPPSPITPAEEDGDFCRPLEALTLTQPAIAVCDKKLAIEKRLSSAIHVLATETAALQNITQLYSSDRFAREAFSRAVDAIARRQGDQGRNGKIVVVGVGKSGHIAKKLVATFNSLAVQAVFLHPTEALHGDLGQISPHDTLLLITFSGKTPELLALLPHLDKSLPLILLTAHTRPQTCELVRRRPDTILLPAPVHEPETASFGVSAPTTSTAVALAVGDALALVASRELHPCVASVFARNHPGGAIGAALRGPPREDVWSLAVRLDEVAELGAVHADAPLTGADVLRAAYASPSGWVRISFPSPSPRGGDAARVVSPRRIRRLGNDDLGRAVEEAAMAWLSTAPSEFIPVAADTSVQKAAEWIRDVRGAAGAGRNDGGYWEDAIVAVMDRGECVGLLEVGRLLEKV